MAKHYNFTDNETINQQAAEWLVRLDGDTPPTAADREALKEWLDRSPVHRERLADLVDMWHGMNVLTELHVPFEKPTSPSKPKDRPVRRFLAFPVGIAAAVILTVALGMWLYPNFLYRSNGQYVTAVGQRQQIELSDGSAILLNTNSQVRVVYSEGFRDIHLLQGEAYFEVAKNKDKPFRVFAGNELVQAVGTAFSVYLKSRDVNVTVSEGRVALASLENDDTNSEKKIAGPRSVAATKVHAARNTVDTVAAGQSATISYSDTAVTTSMEQLDDSKINRRLAWREGLLSFSGESLQEVVEEINRYTSIRIDIRDPAVMAIKIGGQFEVGDTELMLDTLQTNFGLRVVRNGPNHVYILAAQ